MIYICQIWSSIFLTNFFREKHHIWISTSSCQGPTGQPDRSDRSCLAVTLLPPHGPNSKILIPFISPPTPPHPPLSLGDPIGDLEISPRKRRSLCGIWTSSPAWLCSQAGPSSSPSKSCSKGTLWLVLPRSTFLGHRFKFPLVEHLLQPYRTHP